jgi:hypothetical protein
VYRLGFPDWESEPIVADVPFGWLVFHNDHLQVVGRQWWEVGSDGQVKLLGKVPWYFPERFLFSITTQGPKTNEPAMLLDDRGHDPRLGRANRRGCRA